MKVSIALATYNGEKFLQKQLDSLITQTQLIDEIVITDDCSSDNTVKIILNFIKSNPKIKFSFEINKANQGYIRNFYTTLKRTSGDIIFLCDQDDIWLPHKVKTLCSLFKSNKNISAISTAYEFMNAKDEKVVVPDFSGIQHCLLVKKDLKENECTHVSEYEVIRANPSPGCTCAITSKLKDFYVENASLLIPHDWEINMYAAKFCGLYFYNDSLIRYRIHQNNTIGIKYYPPHIKKFFTDNCSFSDDKSLVKSLSLFFSRHYKRPADKITNEYIDGLIKFCKDQNL